MIAVLGVGLFVHVLGASEPKPVYVGFDGEFGLPNSTSAQSIEKGILIAMDEINRAGGVLGGRPLRLVTADNRSMPARGIQNVKDFAKIPDLVAMFSGRFSPVVIETIDVLHELKVINLAPWSSADPVVNNKRWPNYVFRLSLRDDLAMPAMLRYAAARGANRVGLLLTNTSWGRSNLASAERYLATVEMPISVGTAWYNWRDQTLIAHYERLRALGAQAIILVANDDEGATLLREIAALPSTERLPIASHWGVTGGDFVGQAGAALHQNDFAVIQTINFFKFEPEKVERFLKVANRLFGISRIEDIEAPVGIAHAYDLTHILARAIGLAGTTERPAVRDALEQVRDYDGLIKYYERPFTPERHEALSAKELLMARYSRDGVLVPIQ
jgi:branched-chain amino acid transport system substrate-binding protein